MSEWDDLEQSELDYEAGYESAAGRIRELEEALRPFARAADEFDQQMGAAPMSQYGAALREARRVLG